MCQPHILSIGTKYKLGKEPAQLVSRISQINKIVDDFSEDNPSYQACIISGVRGIVNGKTRGKFSFTLPRFKEFTELYM